MSGWRSAGIVGNAGEAIARGDRQLRVLWVHGDGAEEQEEVLAREAATQAARDRIEALATDWPDHLPLIDTLRAQYAHRASHFDDRGSDIDNQGSPPDGRGVSRA